MAIDRERLKGLLDDINGLFDSITRESSFLSAKKEELKSSLLGDAFKEIEDMIYNSKPPTFFFIGRSGHGKSSLINALAKKQVAEEDPIRPKTAESKAYKIDFEERFASWNVIDSRGFFESSTPDNASSSTAEDQLFKDVIEYNPDILFHCVASTEIRSLKKDTELVNQLCKKIKSAKGTAPPIILVITKADTLGNPREWPPSDYPEKAKMLQEQLDYITSDVFDQKSVQLNDLKHLGRQATNMQETDGEYIGFIPVSALWGETWNIESLEYFVGKSLPEAKVLDYAQALRRKDLLRKISTSLTRRFTSIAGVVGSSPLPIADILVLVPLQLLLVSVIASLSCRPLAKESAQEFLIAAGFTAGAGKLFQQLAKLMPGFGVPVSGTIAATGTYCIGKSAEYYFFEDRYVNPAYFLKQLLNRE